MPLCLLSEVKNIAGVAVGTLIGGLVASAVTSGDRSKHVTDLGKYDTCHVPVLQQVLSKVSKNLLPAHHHVRLSVYMSVPLDHIFDSLL